MCLVGLELQFGEQLAERKMCKIYTGCHLYRIHESIENLIKCGELYFLDKRIIPMFLIFQGISRFSALVLLFCPNKDVPLKTN